MGKGYQVSFGDNEDVLKWVVVIDTHLCEYTKRHFIVHFKWVDCLVSEVHFSKGIYKKSGVNREINCQWAVSELSRVPKLLNQSKETRLTGRLLETEKESRTLSKNTYR